MPVVEPYGMRNAGREVQPRRVLIPVHWKAHEDCLCGACVGEATIWPGAAPLWLGDENLDSEVASHRLLILEHDADIPDGDLCPDEEITLLGSGCQLSLWVGVRVGKTRATAKQATGVAAKALEPHAWHGLPIGR